jgi:hypothetical protein
MGWKPVISIVALSLFLVNGCAGNVGRNADDVGRLVKEGVRQGDAVHGVTSQEQTWINKIETSPEDVYDTSCLIFGFARATNGSLPGDYQISAWVNGSASAAAEQYGFDPQALDESQLRSTTEEVRDAGMSPDDYADIFDRACDADKIAF